MFRCEPLRWLLIGRIIFRKCEKHRTSVHDSVWTYHYFGSCDWIEPFLKIASNNGTKHLGCPADHFAPVNGVYHILLDT